MQRVFFRLMKLNQILATFLSINSPPQLVAKEKERTAKLDGHFFLSVAMLMQHSARVQLG